MVDTDDTRRTTDDGRRTTPRVWHKLPTGELKINWVNQGDMHARKIFKILENQYRPYSSTNFISFCKMDKKSDFNLKFLISFVTFLLYLLIFKATYKRFTLAYLSRPKFNPPPNSGVWWGWLKSHILPIC